MDAIQRLTRALEIDPGDVDAMVYLGMCLLERADLAANKSDHDGDIKQADGWVQKAEVARKAGRDHQASSSTLFSIAAATSASSATTSASTAPVGRTRLATTGRIVVVRRWLADSVPGGFGR